MLAAWGVPKLVAVEKLGDYSFKIEFLIEEEKAKVLDSGMWRHKGDALIVIHYDGMVRPSEIHIESTAPWVRLYDLPPTTMKEVHTVQLGNQIKKFIKMDGRFPGYLRYENVPHFSFRCGRIGHALANCDDEGVDEDSIWFGEELRASPPCCVREINLKQVAPRMIKPLFQVSKMQPGAKSPGGQGGGQHAGSYSLGHGSR
jgi:hypothetical protein